MPSVLNIGRAITRGFAAVEIFAVFEVSLSAIPPLATLIAPAAGDANTAAAAPAGGSDVLYR